MASKSDIEWTDASWTPIRARNLKTGKVGWHCEHSTTGCEFCYAEGMNKRLGTGLPFKPGHRKDIEIFLDETMLLAPLRWKKPRMIFVCSMTDLFADFVPDESIDRVFGVMVACRHHTFQVLTKRSDRMREYFSQVQSRYFEHLAGWPIPNIWLGVSAERQQEADARIPHLLQTPAAVRFVSAEPLLSAIDLTRLCGSTLDALLGHDFEAIGDIRDAGILSKTQHPPALDWIIVGGESGPGARPMNLEWADNIVAQCKTAGVSCFVKQLGSRPFGWWTNKLGPVFNRHVMKHSKGGDPSEWPDRLRVREMPSAIQGRTS